MIPQYSIVTAAGSEPITLEQASAHLRVDSADDAAEIQSLISVAREYVDAITGRISKPTTWRLTAETWEDLFETPRKRESEYLDPKRGLTGLTSTDYVVKIDKVPLVSVSSIKYYAPGETSLTTMSASDYRVSVDTNRIQLVESPPDIEDRIDAVQIEFVAGVADTSEVHKHAVKVMVAHLYENRSAVSPVQLSEIPFALRALIENSRKGGYF